MSRLTLLQRQLLYGASALALPLTLTLTPAEATGLPPGFSLSLEGGGVCDLGDEGTSSSAYTHAGVTAFGQTQFGRANCGWTGRIGLSQEKPGVIFGVADFWGVFVRHEDFGTSDFTTSGTASTFSSPKYSSAGVNSSGTFDEDRTVVDFEVGKDIGIGSPGSKVRLFGGVRYSHYSSDFGVSGTTNAANCFAYDCQKYSNDFALHSKDTFDGVGPRLGATGQLPLFGGLFLTATASGSVLWGDHEVQGFTSGPGNGTGRFSSSKSGVVTNAEGELGLGWLLSTNGAKMVVGARWEGWFDQQKFKNYSIKINDSGDTSAFGSGSLDRNNWGPFLRFNIPLGPSPPP